jgi:hypothetical protein
MYMFPGLEKLLAFATGRSQGMLEMLDMGFIQNGA